MFTKVMVANRGEIASRVIKSLEVLGVTSIAVYHRSEKNARFVQDADKALELLGESPSAAYLDISQIIALCQQHQIDAIHPCYGYLAENAEFARASEKAGITFIGPHSDAIELMGDKIRSRQFVEQHGFPAPPSVLMDANDIGFSHAITKLGFPVIVKASAGGGGKGMSIVHSQDDLKAVLKIAASEAEKYFGDNRVYVERYFENARHIEVQVLGDGKDVIHLFERECSIQRRFQKIIEESPSPALTAEKRNEICTAAVGIAKAANYNSAGTVEFIYTPEGEFFFLEMNTRIQVEHPVTEMVTGVDLVNEQIKIAAGNNLSLVQSDIKQTGHAIECRICAENPYDQFMPETGKVLFLREPHGEGIRFDSSLYQGQSISTSFDPMLAKLIVHSSTRSEAITKSLAALDELVLLGITTNSYYLGKILEHSAFNKGAVDTNFVNQYASDLLEGELSEEQLETILSATVLNDREINSLLEKTPEPYTTIGRWRN